MATLYIRYPSTSIQGTITVVQPDGTQLHTTVDSGSIAVTSLPSLPAGSNAIGSVSVTSLPSIPAGSNAIGSVSVSNFPATQTISGSVSVSNFPATQTISGLVTAKMQDGSGNNISSTSGSLNVNLTGGSVTATNSANGNTGSAVPTQATQIAGSDGTLLRALKVSTAGVLSVDGSGVTQPISGSVSVSSLPSIPAGSNAIGSVSVTSLPSIPAGSNAIGSVSVSNFPSTQTISGSVSVSNFPATQPISAASLPLPTGAATSAKQPALGTAGTASTDVLTVQGIASMTALKVDGSAVTQPVSGSVSVSSLPSIPAGSNAIGSVSVSNFPATQTVSGTVTSKTQDGSGNSIGSTSGALNVAITSGSVTATNTANGNTGSAVPTQATQVGGSDGTNLRALKVSTAGVLSVDGSAVTQPVSGTVTAAQGTAAALSGKWPVQVTDGTNVMPTMDAVTRAGFYKVTDGTNTAAVKAASTAAVATDPALVVAVSPNNAVASSRKGSTSANAPVYNVYSSTNITTSAYTQLVASTTSAANAVDIFDSSGQGMILATGTAGSETIVAYVPPGGASYQVAIPASTRVAYKALTANATSGYLLINFWS
jgi:hypothetical protein